MSGGYTCRVSRASVEAQLRDWEAARRRPCGCVQSQRLEDITRLSAGGVAGSSGGGPGGGRAGLGDSRPQSVLCSSLPPELEPMDWRQLRSSVRQSRGSRSGWGPRARASMSPSLYGAEAAGAPRQVAAYFRTQFLNLCDREDRVCPVHI